MFDDIISAAADRYNVPAPWVYAVIDVESAWNPDAFRAEPQIQDGSYGLMQLLTRTARNLGFVGSSEDLYDPETNIDLGTKLLGQLRTQYGDDFRRIYSAYNSGRPDLWETSSEVAAHVARALDSLSKYIGEAAETITQQPATSGIVAIIAAVLLWAWTSKRR